MKANELMIGDWVRCGKRRYMKVTQLAENMDCDDINPVHLTPEILEKNGFVANKHVYPYPYYEFINKEDKLKVGFAFPQGNRTSYKDPWVYIDSERVFVEHLPCMFVHELQHALKLCGIEKEIEL